MSTNELEMKCQELRELQRLIEEAQAEAETIKDAIKAHLGYLYQVRGFVRGFYESEEVKA